MGEGDKGVGLGVAASPPLCRPSGEAAKEASSAKPAAANAVRFAVVQALDGHLTCCGPDDFSTEHDDAMSAAICWHLEAGHLPAATYWIEAELPPIPSIPELRAKADVGEFPKSIIADWDAQ